MTHADQISTPQSETWSGRFGHDYTDRNVQTPSAADELYRLRFGVSRSEMNREFLGDLDRSVRILEVGANVGVQLRLLKELGFRNLHGLELQDHAIEIARRAAPEIEMTQGNALELPFEGSEFDLVFTSGVLIHISPEDHERVIREMLRCSARWIWGFEYYAAGLTPVIYRGRENLLWKTDFASLFRTLDTDLRLVKERRYRYLDQPELVDTMYLLESRC